MGLDLEFEAPYLKIKSRIKDINNNQMQQRAELQVSQIVSAPAIS